MQNRNFLSNENAPMFISVKEAAARMSVSERSVREALRRGDLNAGRFGKRVLLRWSDCEVFVMRSRDAGSTDEIDVA